MASPLPPDPAALLAQTDWLRRLARGLVHEEALADEVVQETWLAALQRRPAGDHAGGLRAWLTAVARRQALRLRRREHARRAVEERAARPEAQAAAPDGLARLELQRHLAAAVLALDEPYRTAVILRCVEGLSHREIAQRTDCRIPAARQHVARGLGQLRARLARELGAGRAWSVVLLELAGARGSWTHWIGGIGMGTKVALAAGAGVLVAVLAWLELEGGGRAGSTAAERAALVEGVRVPERQQVAPPPVQSLAAPAVAQSASTRGRERAPSADPAATPRVAGRVTDSRGRALEGAEVRLGAEREAPRVTTPASGAFGLEVPGSRAVRLALVVTCAGYVERTLEVSAGSELEIALAARPALVGQLLDPAGVPATPPGRVELEVEEAGTDTRRQLECELDAAGGFAFRDLAPGRVLALRARALGFARTELAPERVAALSLVPDGIARVDVELAPGAFVTGRVVDATSRAPIPGARVWVECVDGPPSDALIPAARADEQGRFALRGAGFDVLHTEDLDLCLFVLQGAADGYVASPGRAYASQRDAAGRYDFELELRRAAAGLWLRVRQPDGALAVAAEVYVVDSEANALLRPTDAAGLLTLEELPAGAVTVWVTGRGGSARSVCELAAGETRGEEITLVPDRGRIEVRLLDLEQRGVSAPLVLERHLAAPGRALAQDHARARTDATGAFVFESLPVGGYELRVELAEGLCTEPQRAHLELGPSDHASVELVVGPALIVAGRVELGDVPADLLELDLRRAGSQTSLARARPDPDGRFRFDARLAERLEVVLLRAERVLDRSVVDPRVPGELVLRVGP